MSSKRLGLLALVVTAMIVAACAPQGDQGQVATLQAQLAAAQAGGQGAGNADQVATLQAELAAAQAASAATEAPSFKPEFKNADTFVWYTISAPDSLDPASDYETFGSEIMRQTYDTLVFFKEGKVDEFVPMLATEWKISDDGLTYTFTIRKDVKFHDGGTLEPHDVAYSFHRNMLSGWDNELGGPQWINLEALFGTDVIGAAGSDAGLTGKLKDDLKVCETVKAAVVADDAAGTVVITLDHPTGYFMQALASGWSSIIDQEWMASKGDWGGDCKDWRTYYGKDIDKTTLYATANGTGPYKLTKYDPGNEIVLEANADWWLKEPMWEGSTVKGVPSIKTFTVKSVDEWGTRLAALQAGDADVITVPSSFYDQIDPMVKEQLEYPATDIVAKNPNGSLRMYHNLPGGRADDIFMNFNIAAEGGNPLLGSGKLDGKGIPADFFSDVHVRKAMNYCFDRETYLKEVLKGEAIDHRGPIVADMLGYDPKSFVYTYDLDKCAEELKLAWNGDVAKNGFTLPLLYNAGNDDRKIGMELLRDGILAANSKMAEGDREKQNISVSTQGMAWPSYLAGQRNKTLTVYFIGWQEDFHHPHNWVGPYASCTGLYGGRASFPTELCSPWDDLMQKAVRETDNAKASAMYAEIQKGTIDAAVDIFGFQLTARRYEQLWITGYYYNPLLFAPGYLPAMSKVAP